MITLLKKIAIRPMDEPDNIVTLTNIMEGVDGSATFGYSLEPVALQVEDNQTQQYKHIHTFDVRVIEESSDSAIIDGWIASQTKVQIVGQGIDGMFFMDDVLLTRNKQYDEVLASAFLATVETLTSFTRNHPMLAAYNGSTPRAEEPSLFQQVYAGTSLIDRFDLRLENFYEYNTNTWQNGWDKRTDISSNVNVSTNIVRFESVGATKSWALTETQFMPFEDQAFIATMNVTNVDVNSNTAPEFYIVWQGVETSTNTNINRARAIQFSTTGLKVVSFDAQSLTDFEQPREIGLGIEFQATGQVIEFDSITFSVAQSIPGTTPGSTSTITPDPTE